MPDIIKQIFWSACYYFFLLMFFTGIWILNGVALILPLFLPPRKGRAALRQTLYKFVNLYITLMELSGPLINNREILKPIRESKGGLLVIANHPSMFDAPLLLSTLPGLVCVFKSALKQGLLLPHTARTAGYLSNDEGMDMLRQMAEALRCGEKVLVFPEGTRTNGLVLNPLNKGYALAALRSRVPVQLIGIRVNTPILSKRQHFLKSARWPVTFRLEMGPTIEPSEFKTVHQMNSFVESWFRQHLASTEQSAKSYLPANVESRESDGVITTHFQVPIDPFYCRGHMPGNPIVPAYTQMAWIHEILQQRFPSPISRIEYTRMKFIQTVLPGNDIEILIQLDGANGRIRINQSSEKVSQGRVHVHCEGDEK